MKGAARAIVPPLVVIAAALLLWELAVRICKPPAYLLPGPIAVAHAIVESPERLLGATLRTALSTLSGFLIAAISGIVLGSVLGASKFLERGFYPLATLFQMVPLVAMAPLLVIWFHYGLGATVAASAIVALFPVLANTLDGLRSVDPGWRELFTISRAGRFTTWWKLGLPAATPQIITGLRIAAGLALIGTIVGEFVSGYAGDRAPLGVVIIAAMRENRADLVFAAIVLSALVGLILFGMVGLIGWLVLRRWHASATSMAGLVLAMLVPLLLLACERSPSGGGASGDGGGGARAKVRLQLNWVPEPEFGGIYAALERGFYAEEGIDLEVIKGGAGVSTPQLIAAGACDFGVVSADQILQIREQGGEIVALFAIFQRSPVGIMLHASNPIDSLEALWRSDSTVAIEPGLPYVTFLNRRYGGDRLKLVPYSGALAIFTRDPTMAHQCFISAEPVQMELQGVPVKVFSLAESGYDPYTAVIATSRANLESRPDLAERLVRATRRGWEAYLAEPARYNPRIASLNPAMSLDAMNRAAQRERPFIESSWTREHGLGSMDENRWRELAAQMVELGLIRTAPEPSALYRNLR